MPTWTFISVGLIVLVAQPAEQSELGSSVFILLLVVVGSFAAGIFLAAPVARRIDARRHRAGGVPPWSTGRPDHQPDLRPLPPDQEALQPWSTGAPDEDALQRHR